jgi:hypothetical protein
LRSWRLLAYLPVESVIRERQEACYAALAEADERADATPFVEFMLKVLCDAIREAVAADQVGDHVTDQVASLIQAIGGAELGSAERMKTLGLTHRPTFRPRTPSPQPWTAAGSSAPSPARHGVRPSDIA